MILRCHGVSGLKMSDNVHADRIVIRNSGGVILPAYDVQFCPSPAISEGGTYFVTIKDGTHDRTS